MPTVDDEAVPLHTPDRRGSGAFKWDLAAEGEIPMWVADMDFAVAPAVTSALQRRLEHPVFGYTGVPDSYREAVTQWEARRNDWTIDPRHLVVVPSVMPAIALAIEMLTEPGDRILTTSPVYFPFFEVIEHLDREVVRVPLATDGDRYVLDLDAVAAAVAGSNTPNAGGAALFLLCSPHNPGGRVWSREELTGLREVLARAAVPVLADEIHSDLTFPGETFVPWMTTGGATRRDVSLIAPSKTFNIPGLPTATAIVPDTETRRRYRAILNAHMLRLPNLLAITAAEAAYRGAERWLDTVRGAIADRYGVLRELLAEEDEVSVFSMEGTFIAWIDLRARWGYPAAGEDPAAGPSTRFGALAREHGVWLSSGRQFGPEGEGFMRINLATDGETMREGVRRLRQALAAFDPAGGDRE